MIDNNSVLTIPHDFEAEQVTLGSIIFNSKNFDLVSNILSPNSFHVENHRHIYRAMCELSEMGEPVDEILLGDQLKELGKLEDIGGYPYLVELVDAVPSSGNIVYYAKVIQEHAVVRDLITTFSDLSRKARDPQQGVSDLIIEAETKLSEISSRQSKKSTMHIGVAVNDSLGRLKERSENNDTIVGLPTGFTALDNVICGLIAPNMVTVAADSGVGKTTFALNIVENIYLRYGEKRGTVIYSREMANYQLSDRMLCSSGKLNSRIYKIGNLEQSDYDKLAFAADNLSSKNIHFNDELYTIDQIAHETKYLHKHIEGGLCFAVIDYLQLMEGVSKRNREQEISYISRSVKRLAKQLNIPIMPLSQLNRDLRKRSDKRPIRSDLRESAAIEHDSDIIIFLYRDEFYNEESTDKGIAEVRIDKHRDGSVETVLLSFKGEQTRFGNIQKYDQMYYQGSE